MWIERGMDKELVVHLYKGILINLIKKRIWVTWAEVDEPAACYVEWSKSERENQILYIYVYMESRKMALVNLFSGQEERHRQRTCLWTQQGKERASWIERVAFKHSTLPYVKYLWIASGKRLCEPGSLPSALWQPREVGWGAWWGDSRRRGYMYTYGWFSLLYSRNQHIVKQLYSNKKQT